MGCKFGTENLGCGRERPLKVFGSCFWEYGVRSMSKYDGGERENEHNSVVLRIS